MKTRMRKLVVMLIASAMVFTMTIPAPGADSMPDDTAAIEEKEFSVQAYTGKGDTGNDQAPDEDSYEEVPENWDVDSDPGTWSTATKYVKLEFGQEYYNGEYGYEEPEEGEEETEEGGEGGDDSGDDLGVPPHGRIIKVYSFKITKELYGSDYGGMTVGEYLETGGDPITIVPDGDWYIISSKDQPILNSIYKDLYEIAEEMGNPDENIEIINLYEGEDVFEEGIPWVVYSPFSYFFKSQDGNNLNPDDNYVRDGKVIQKDGVKNDGNYAYKAITVDQEKKIYVLLRYWTLEEEGAEKRLGDHFIVRRFDEKSYEWVEDEINSRYNGNEMVLPYTGAKHIFDDGKSVKNAKKDKDIFVEAVLVSYNAAAKKTSVIKGLSVKNLKVKNNVAATVPGENWVYPTDMENRAGDFGYSRIQTGGDNSTVTYSGFTSVPQLTANENKNFRGQPSFTVKAAAVGDAKPFLKAVNKALKKEVIPFEISRFKVAEDSLNATWTFEEILATENEDEIDDAVVAGFDMEVEAVYQKYLEEYAYAVKVLFPKEYAGLTVPEIRDRLSDPERRRSIVLDTDLEPDYIPVEWNDGTAVYRRYIEFKRVPFYVDPEIDLLALENGFLQRNDDLVKLDTSNEKGGTTLKFNKKGKSRLKLVLLDYMNLYKEDKNTLEGFGGKEQQVYQKKAFSRKVKLSKKAGGKQDIFVQDRMTQDGIPFVLITGQNNMCGVVPMRLKTDIYGSAGIAVGFYKDENHYYIESED